jgi:hypothetical protein
LEVAVFASDEHRKSGKMKKANPFAQNMCSRKPSFLTVVAGFIVCVFAVQILGFVFSSSGRAAFADGRVGLSIAISGEICASKPGKGEEAPRHSSHYHCAFCSLSDRDIVPDAVVSSTSVIDFGQLWAEKPNFTITAAITRMVPGWGSSWSSRAPPAFS